MADRSIWKVTVSGWTLIIIVENLRRTGSILLDVNVERKHKVFLLIVTLNRPTVQ